MDRKSKREWLEGYQVMASRIRRLDFEAEELQETFGDARIYFGKGYSNTDLCKDLRQMFRQIEREKRQAIMHQRRIQQCIETVADEVERKLLHMRYIKDLSWYEIATNLMFSYEHVKGHKLNRALDNLQIPSGKTVNRS